MNYIVFGNVAVSSWDATYNADGSVPGALGPDARSVGDILAASSRWQKAVVAAVDAAGRPTRIAAVLGAINPMTVADVTSTGQNAATTEQMRAWLSTAAFVPADLQTKLGNNAGKAVDMTQADITLLLTLGGFGQSTVAPVTAYNILPVSAHIAGYLPYVNADNTFHAGGSASDGLMTNSGGTSWENLIISNGETVVCATLSY
jgi:hypothetical protein